MKNSEKIMKEVGRTLKLEKAEFEKRLEASIAAQRRQNKYLSRRLGCDEKTAYGCANEVKRYLKVHVKMSLLFLLVDFFYSVGVKRFERSFILDITNSGVSQSLILKSFS